MLSFRSVLRRGSVESVAPSVAMPVLDGHRESLVPCNNLRARWVVAENGKLELRWELPQAPSQARAA
jgi:hypothetical protein